MKKSEENAQRLMQDFYRITRSRHVLFHELLSRNDITMHQFHLLLYMKSSGKTKVTDLGQKMLVSMPTASRMLNTICDKGLAKKTRDDRDRRLTYVELTRKGERVVEQVHARQREVLAQVMEEIPDGEVEAFLATMEKIAEQLTALKSDNQGG